MKRAFFGAIAGIAVLGGVFGAAGTALTADQHIATVVCHWVPAKGGTVIEIVVDDDGADGNPALQAHYGHENDIINPVGGNCSGGDED